MLRSMLKFVSVYLKYTVFCSVCLSYVILGPMFNDIMPTTLLMEICPVILFFNHFNVRNLYCVLGMLNIYNPPGHPTHLLSSAFCKIINLGIKHTIIGGDFNCHLNPVIDKSPPGKPLLSSHAKFVNAFCEDMDYEDVCRAQHLADKEYTFFSNVSQSSTRIDCFLLPKTSLCFVISNSIGPIIICDHAAVFLQYTLSHPPARTRYWKFKPFILTDDKFATYFRDEFKFFFSTNATSTTNSSLVMGDLESLFSGYYHGLYIY